MPGRLTYMASEEMRAAVERIKSDPEFAQRAYEAPEAVLPIEFDLDPSQWQAVHRALAADAEAGDEDVGGFVLLDWGSRQMFPNLDALVSLRDAATGQASGKRQHTFIKEWDKPSP
jgi:hypothetical protein